MQTPQTNSLLEAVQFRNPPIQKSLMDMGPQAEMIRRFAVQGEIIVAS